MPPIARWVSAAATPLFAATLLAPAGGCGEECVIVPTIVELEPEAYFVEARGELALVAETTLGLATCGPSPTEVVAYHWVVDGEPLVAEDDEPLGPVVVIRFEERGVHVVEVRVEDDVGAEIPSVGRASILVY